MFIWLLAVSLAIYGRCQEIKDLGLPSWITQYTTAKLPKQNLFGRQKQQPPALCPHSYNGFHVVFNATGYLGAEEVCQSFGYTLARVDDLNLLYAVQTIQECEPNMAYWTFSFNGLMGIPCAYMAGVHGMLFPESSRLCRLIFIPVLCQEKQVITDTTTTTTTTTQSDGTETVSTTVTRHSQKPPLCCAPHNKVYLQDKVNQEPKVECSNCSAACQIGDTNFRALKRAVPFQRAAPECARYGWTLADITAGQLNTFIDPFAECTSTRDAYIRSYNGVSGGRCLWIALNPAYNFGPFVFFGFTSNGCNEEFSVDRVKPLCQCNKVLPTGFGPTEIPKTTTSTTMTVTEVDFVPSTTVTVTSTICQNCHFDDSTSSSESEPVHEQRKPDSHLEDFYF